MNTMKMSRQGIEATLAGIKINTRRPIKNIKVLDISYEYDTVVFEEEDGYQSSLTIEEFIKEYSKYKIGEVVKATTWVDLSESCRDCKKGDGMWAHQFDIKITGIKAEFLQDISKNDCFKEGVRKRVLCNPCQASHEFEYEIWNNLPYKAPNDWPSNPPVFAYEYEMVS